MSAPDGPRPVTPAGILAAELGDLYRELAALDGIPAALTARMAAAYALAGGLDDYVGAHTTPESPALAELARRTRAEDWSRHRGTFLEQEMLSGHVEGQALKMLVHATGARRVLEIGMFTGYSALAMAEALAERGSADGRVVACEIDADVAAFARRAFDAAPAGDRVEIRVGPARDTLTDLARAGATFDLVFLDADKAGYLDHVHAVLDGDLLGPDGLLVVDNTLMQGLPWRAPDATANATAIAAFNRALADDPRVVQVVLPVRDGLTLARRIDR